MITGLKNLPNFGIVVRPGARVSAPWLKGVVEEAASKEPVSSCVMQRVYQSYPSLQGKIWVFDTAGRRGYSTCSAQFFWKGRKVSFVPGRDICVRDAKWRLRELEEQNVNPGDLQERMRRLFPRSHIVVTDSNKTPD